MTRRLSALLLALLVAGVSAPAALADGLPVLGTDAGPEGVSSTGADARYLTLPAGRGTVIARVETGGGRVPVSRFLPRNLVVPVVAYDGSASGLSADGRTLVLIRPRRSFPQRETTLTVLDTRGLRVTRRLTLPGDFSFDALSPEGRWLYLIQYISPRDMTRYRVRAYDLRAGRLLRAPIVDPNERPDEMRGMPVTREASPDGRWAYTLYDGSGGHPFVHALDTTERTAACIDLHALKGARDIAAHRLSASADGRRLTVRSPTRPAAVIDTRTFRVSAPVRTRPAAVAGSTEARDGPWTALGAVGAAALLPLATGAALVRRRRAR